MPQITNRKLVGEMAATPMGRGTVYSSMLKACSTNRERAARVNDSERQKLQKATSVIDKHNRHNQWKCDQDIQRVRHSLMKLDAFQRVLHEDYPVKNLIGKTSSRKKKADMVTNAASASRKKSTHHDDVAKRTDIHDSTNQPNSNKDEHYKEHDFKSTKEVINITEDGNNISTEPQHQKQKEVTFHQDSEEMSQERYASQRQPTDVIEIIASVNTTTPQTPTTHHPSMVDGSPKQNEANLSALRRTLTSDINSISLLGSASCDGSTTVSNSMKSHNTELMKAIQRSRNNVGIESKTPAGSVERDSKVTTKPAPTKSVHETKASTTSDVTTLPEATPEQRKKDERIRKLRTDWKTMMETRVCNRGFDMNTLHTDIQRKLKRMDISRRHTQLKKCLLEESMAANQRIIRTSKAKFDTVMMEPQHHNVQEEQSTQ